MSKNAIANFLNIILMSILLFSSAFNFRPILIIIRMRKLLTKYITVTGS